MGEVILHNHFSRVARSWWVLVVTSLLGAGTGLFFHVRQPTLYEARAIFYISIDLAALKELEIPDEFFQYNEDLALGITQSILVLPDLLQEVAVEGQRQGYEVSPENLLQNSTIERKHAIWELRYRNPDALVAQFITGLWASKAYEIMQAWKEAGRTAGYVIFTPPGLEKLPQEPVRYGRNRLMLAGLLVGFAVGIILIEATRLNPK